MAKRAAKNSSAKKPSPKRWSRHVMETSDAMDIDAGTFKSKDPKRIARSLKKSAETSDRRKAKPYQSAVSMLTFYINRAGHNLPAAQLKILEKAKADLAALFGREAPAAARRKPGTSGKSRAASRAKRS